MLRMSPLLSAVAARMHRLQSFKRDFDGRLKKEPGAK
jgi:hypothetical protein